MGRVSTFKQLPPEVRNKIGELFDRGCTLNEVMQALESLDVTLSRSALHRAKQRIDKIGEKIRRSREIADSVVRNLGDIPENKATRMNMELMQGVILDILSQADDEIDSEKGGASTPMGAMLLAKALEHLAKTARHDAELTTKLKESAKKEVEAKLEAAAKEAAAEGKGSESQQVFERIMAIYRGEG